MFIGVEDDGTVSGIPKNSGPDIIKTFTSTSASHKIISPPVCLTAKVIKCQ
ncbi:MAG: hypothetical protein LBP22_16060 [Deltaproteobacteria bacterium]|nr:hypothetical protein [Deltaproteobacteria bacterium]